MHFRIHGKGSKIRFVVAHPLVLRLIHEYIELAMRHGVTFEPDGPLFRPVANNRTGTTDRPLDTGSVYRNIVLKYARNTGVSAEAI